MHQPKYVLIYFLSLTIPQSVSGKTSVPFIEKGKGETSMECENRKEFERISENKKFLRFGVCFDLLWTVPSPWGNRIYTILPRRGTRPSPGQGVLAAALGCGTHKPFAALKGQDTAIFSCPVGAAEFTGT